MSSEALLWCAVVEQAFLDATSRLLPARRRCYVDRDEARAWLLYPSEDFTQTCSMAGVDPDCVRQCAVDMALAGWHRPH